MLHLRAKSARLCECGDSRRADSAGFHGQGWPTSDENALLRTHSHNPMLTVLAPAATSCYADLVSWHGRPL